MIVMVQYSVIINPLRNYNEMNNPNSPTQSQMEDPQIMVIIRDYEINRNYEINKEKLRKDFMSPEYDDKRTWFFNKFSQIEQNHIRTRWYNYMNETKTDIYFFPRFEHNYAKINIGKVNTITRAKNNWMKLQTNEVVHKEHSPYESITLPHRGLLEIIIESRKTKNAPKAHYNVAFLKKLFAPTRKVCKKVTANISPGYNGAQKPLFV
jgi:hypothetical protein